MPSSSSSSSFSGVGSGAVPVAAAVGAAAVGAVGVSAAPATAAPAGVGSGAPGGNGASGSGEGDPLLPKGEGYGAAIVDFVLYGPKAAPKGAKVRVGPGVVVCGFVGLGGCRALSFAISNTLVPYQLRQPTHPH